MEEPTHLPEGAEVELLPLDPGDWLAPDDRALLHRALLASQEDVEGGRLVDAAEVLRSFGGFSRSADTRNIYIARIASEETRRILLTSWSPKLRTTPFSMKAHH